MRIFYDGRNYFPPQGVGRYFRNIIERLPAAAVPILSVTNLQTPMAPRHPQIELLTGFTVPSKRVYLRSAAVRALATQQLRVRSRQLSYDVAHPTYYDLLVGRPFDWLRGPVVVTVYDLIHEIFPEMDPGGQVHEAKRIALERADAIICISEHTRSDLLERFDVAEDRVITTLLAADISADMAAGAGRVPDGPYLLYVGARAGYKNFALVLAAMERLRSLPDLRLVVVGARFTKGERQELSDRRLDGVVCHVGQVEDGHLAKLYRSSLAFVYPSLYEGFGIPPLEAMACGTAVIAAATSSIPEVVDDAALLIQPDRVDELVDAVRELYGNPTLRAGLVTAGAARALHFTWAKTAALTSELYQTLAG